jgi:PAS domain S-box-containing protein
MAGAVSLPMINAATGELGASESLELIETHGVGTWSWELGTTEVRWSPGLSQILGIEHGATEQSLSVYEQLVHPDDRAAFRDPRQLATGGVMADSEHRILRPDGELRWVRSRGKTIHARDGRPERLVGVAFDTTEVRLGQQALQQREGLLDAIRDLFHVVIWTTDADGGVSDEVEWWRATGQRGRVDHWNRLEAVHPDDRQRVRQGWDEAVRTRGRYTFASRVLWGESYVPVVSSAVPLVGRGGALEGWIGFTTRQDSMPLDLGLGQSEAPPLTAGQVRAARGYLGWSAEQLADRAGVSFSTVRRVETPGGRVVRKQSLAAIRRALEDAGLSFSTSPDGKNSVSMKA